MLICVLVDVVVDLYLVEFVIVLVDTIAETDVICYVDRVTALYSG